METMQLLKIPVEEFVSLLLNMKAKECERHARNILEKLEGPAYENVMWSITQNLLSNNGDEKDHLLRFHKIVANHFPSIDENDDTLGKLTFLIYLIVYKRSDLLIDRLTMRSN